MRAHVAWPADPNDDPPVFIQRGGSPDEILREGYVTALLKSRDVQTLGVMLDADENPDGRYQRARSLCAALFPSMPTTLSPGGVVVANGDGKRFGIWIMPDNVSPGYLETFLRYLVPNQQEPLWTHAVGSVAVATGLGATCRNTHLGKAHLYTWLAWQDPPGRAPGIALTHKVLDPNSGAATNFVTWFKSLYQLQ